MKFYQRALLATIAMIVGFTASRWATAGLDPIAPWPTANRDLRHTSRAPFVGPSNPKIKWTYTANDTAWGPEVGRDGTIYVPSNDGSLYALHPDGTLKWTFDLKVSSGNGTPSQHAVLGDDGTIYCAGASLFAINPDGSKKWQFDAANLPGLQSPTFGPDGRLYQTATDGTLYVIDPATGKQIWSHQYIAGQRIQAPISFAADGDPILSYRVANVPNVFKIDLQGNPIWSFTGPDEMRAATIGDDGTVYAATANTHGSVFALNPDTGVQLWSYTVSDPTAEVEFPSIGWDGDVYLGTQVGLYKLTPKGAMTWVFDTTAFIKDPVEGTGLSVHQGNPIIDAVGNLYDASSIENFWMIGPDGKHIADITTPALNPRMAMGADGTLYAGSRAGVIYAFGDDATVGDGNKDGKINIQDVTLALRKAVGLDAVTSQDLRVYDVAPLNAPDRPYGDGKINIQDVTVLLNQVVNPKANWPYTR